MISNNIPEVKLGLIASSRSNFADELSETSREQIGRLLLRNKVNVHVVSRLVVTEEHAVEAVREAKEAGCNALAVILGNFGPETAETLIAKFFEGPVMYAAVSEIDEGSMYGARRDAYCGMLNCSYNLDIRSLNAYVPQYPVGTPEEICQMIRNYIPVARGVIGLRNLKVITFGPRPNDFLACNAPIKPIFTLGAEIQENSELDLYLSWLDHKNDKRIPGIVEEMKRQVGGRYEDTLVRMAQYEVTLLDWIEQTRGASSYVTLASKCWSAFQKAYGFLPCFVHSRLAGRGIPVGCETDVYGALSEFIGDCLSDQPTAILDINNDISEDIYRKRIKGIFPYSDREVFIGFHCGNTAQEMLCSSRLTYKMNRKDPYAAETGKEENRGTLEGRLRDGKVSVFRLHADADGKLQSYIGDGEILPIDLDTYGCYAVFGIPHMDTFYRQVLIEKHFPHHSAIVYGDHSAQLFELMRFLNIPYIGCNQTKADAPGACPFEYQYKVQQ